MKLAIFKNEADVKEIEKVEGFVGMVGEDCGCRNAKSITHEERTKILQDAAQEKYIEEENQKTREEMGEEKYKKMVAKMESLKKLSSEKFAEKKGKRLDDVSRDLEAVGDIAGKLLVNKAEVIKAMEQAPISNKPEWIEAPPKAKILAYWPKDGWLFGTYESAETIGCGWQGTGYGSWLIPKYKRMDETVKDWKKSLTKRPVKSITMKEGLERIEKIIDEGVEQKKTADIFDKIKGEDKVIQDFAKKLLDYMYKKKLGFANGTTVKDGTGKRFGLMADKNKMMERLVAIGVFTKTEKGWEPV